MKKYIIIVLSVITIIILSFFYYSNEEEQTEEFEVEEVEEEKEIVKSIFCVDIKGAINKPGVYCLEDGGRVLNVIEAAGGLKSTADTSVINLSKKISDEMTIIIYTKIQIKDAINRLNSPTIIEIIKEVEKECICPDTNNDACINETINETSLVNINNATKEQLMTLPGIGESKADAIITYRIETPFSIIDDLKNVPGIGDSTFESLKQYITV